MAEGLAGAALHPAQTEGMIAYCTGYMLTKQLAFAAYTEAVEEVVGLPAGSSEEDRAWWQHEHDKLEANLELVKAYAEDFKVDGGS